MLRLSRVLAVVEVQANDVGAVECSLGNEEKMDTMRGRG